MSGSAIRRRVEKAASGSYGRCVMASIADRIMRRLRAKGKGKWVCTPSDFLDFGSPASVRQALARLARKGEVRRVGRGLYDLPLYCGYLKKLAAVKYELAVDAIVRRDGIRVMRGGLMAANDLHLTNCVPAQIVYMTDGVSRNIDVDGWTIRFQHVGQKLMAWRGRPAAPVARALDWLGPYASQDPRIIPTLRRVLPDYVKEDLIRNCSDLPKWALPIAHGVVTPEEKPVAGRRSRRLSSKRGAARIEGATA